MSLLAHEGAQLYSGPRSIKHECEMVEFAAAAMACAVAYADVVVEVTAGAASWLFGLSFVWVLISGGCSGGSHTSTGYAATSRR